MSATNEIFELFTAIAMGVLSALFLSAFVILVFVCKRTKFFNLHLYLKGKKLVKRPISDLMMIEPDDVIFYKNNDKHFEKSEMEIDTVCFNENFDYIFRDQQWLDDVSGLIPHCLAILKCCRSLTERLTALAMGIINTSGFGLKEIVTCAKKISLRVDEMVQSMYPPLNPQLLEARATALMLAVTHLALIAQYECRSKKIAMDWIERSMKEIEGHIEVIKEASNNKSMTNGYSSSVIA
ncbi:PREDICTED: transmembrane protein 98-like [Nicrophorus vespilloides]|uniref:Transmembrane protein 98 n=1 Tax=Nicrophorus vespilloides TaxID=110193 RepID=A0ABM1NGX6_NICVS|nr:PREDICTED: transmembrane protein 98-like [Nicrophorus vespilloides]